jgi:hypothetical protein
MWHIPFGRTIRRDCNGISRRHMLHVGAMGLFGGLTLPRLLESEARAGASAARAKSCIFLFLEGGPPHQDMWDPKPDAPIEIRGPFNPIATSVPGTFVVEHCTLSAKIAHKFTILRSHSHADNGHTTGYHYVMTGRRAAFADGENPIPNNSLYPSIGSIVSRELGTNGSVPPYVNIPHPMQAGGPGFYGAEHAPFVIESDPSQSDFEVKDLSALSSVSASRMELRRRLLAGVERSEQKSPGRAGVMSTYYEKAYGLISSAAARKAFDIHSEPDALRDRYGRTQLGQCALFARRLVEAGCRFVGVDGPGWDVHLNCFPSLKDDLIPPADRAFSALVEDLDQRGLLDSTLVVMMGEMGRTPRVNAQAGRDHWSMAQTCLFAGGGIKPGQVIGATDKYASAVVSDPMGVNDILKTICHLMGIDSDKTYYSPIGRPIPVVDGGRVLSDLIA